MNCKTDDSFLLMMLDLSQKAEYKKAVKKAQVASIEFDGIQFQLLLQLQGRWFVR